MANKKTSTTTAKATTAKATTAKATTAKATTAKATTAAPVAPVAPVALRRQIEKQAAEVPAEWGAETADATLMLHGVKGGVFASLEHLPLLTAKQAAQLGAAVDTVVLDDAHALAISKATGREYRQHNGKPTDIGTIDPLAVSEGFRRFFRAMLKKRHESAALALHYCTKGLRKQAKSNKPAKPATAPATAPATVTV